jgi:hypothetical protein
MLKRQTATFNLVSLTAWTALLTLSSTIHAQKHSGKYHSNAIGAYDLPIIPETELRVRVTCTQFSEACAAEAAGKFDTAIQLYEKKYAECGDVGWNITGHAAGSNDFVVFKTTPCGLHLAIKQAKHTKECLLMKNLTTGGAYNACPGCFPRFYFLSNFTRACYTEYVDMVPLFKHRYKYTNASHAVHVMRGIVENVAVLRAHGIEHRDLSLRNMRGRYVGNPPRLQVVFFDFGASKPLEAVAKLDKYLNSTELAEKIRIHEQRRNHSSHDAASSESNSNGRNLAGNGIHPDLYAATCSVYRQLYSLDEDCNLRPPARPSPPDVTSFRYAITKIMQENQAHSIKPDIRGILSALKAVTKL